MTKKRTIALVTFFLIAVIEFFLILCFNGDLNELNTLKKEHQELLASYIDPEQFNKGTFSFSNSLTCDVVASFDNGEGNVHYSMGLDGLKTSMVATVFKDLSEKSFHYPKISETDTIIVFGGSRDDGLLEYFSLDKISGEIGLVSTSKRLHRNAMMRGYCQ